ncbi:MAG: hypothetical protein K2G26_05055 [Clostridia bacterium]|nr:hypothetical protein [Clostridia bacterium]
MENNNELTQKDIVRIITILNLNYTENYGNYGEEETKQLRDYWFESLKTYPRDIIFNAVRKSIEKSEFIPKLSTILAEIENIFNAKMPFDDELWAELNTVLPRVYDLSRYLKYPQYVKWANEKLDGVYSGLSEELKLFVVNRSTLIDIAEMSPESLQLERMRFFKQMPILKKHKIDKDAAQRLVAQTFKTQALLNGNDKK